MWCLSSFLKQMLPFPLRVYTWRRHPPCFTLLFPEGPFFLLVHLYPSLSAFTLLDNTALTLSVEIGCWPCVHSFTAINHQIFKILGHCLWHCFFFLTSEFVGMTHPRSWLTSPLQWHLPHLHLSHIHLQECLHLQPCHHQFMQPQGHHFKGNTFWTVLSIFPNCFFCYLQSSHPELMGFPASACLFCLTQYSYPCPE